MNHVAMDNPSYLRKKLTSPTHTLPCWEIDASLWEVVTFSNNNNLKKFSDVKNLICNKFQNIFFQRKSWRKQSSTIKSVSSDRKFLIAKFANFSFRHIMYFQKIKGKNDLLAQFTAEKQHCQILLIDFKKGDNVFGNIHP